MRTNLEVGIMRLDHFVCSEALSRNVTLMEVVEFANPSSHCDHVDANDGKD